MKLALMQLFLDKNKKKVINIDPFVNKDISMLVLLELRNISLIQFLISTIITTKYTKLNFFKKFYCLKLKLKITKKVRLDLKA